MESVNELLEHPDPEQCEVTTHFGVPLCVHTGAGTRRMRAIMYRITHATRAGILDPRNIMVLTFMSRTMGGPRSRLYDPGVRGVSTHIFHTAALRQISCFWGTAIGSAVPPIAGNRLSMVAQAAGQLGMTIDSISSWDMTSEIEWLRVNLMTPDDYPDRALGLQRDQAAGYPTEGIVRLAWAYEDAKQNRGVIDFENVPLSLIGILIDRPDVIRMVRDQYRHFVIGEYQDVSPLQHRLLQLWMGERRDPCVMGDVPQTIYSSTGASPRYLADFAQGFRDVQVLELTRDYRSSPQIVACVNGVIAPGTSKDVIRLVSWLPSSIPVVFKGYGDDVRKARVVAAEILQLREEGVGLTDTTALYWTDAQSAEFEAALGRADADYSIRGSERLFSRHEVRETMMGMRAAARAEAGGTLADNAKTMPMQRGWREQPSEGTGVACERWSTLVVLLKMAREMERAHGAGMIEFVAELEERMQVRATSETDSMTFAFLHSVKGLE